MLFSDRRKLAVKRDEPHSVMMSWIRKKISFSIIKSIITCIHGNRSIRHEREKHNVEKLASYSEARCNTTGLIKKCYKQYKSKNMLN